MGKAFLSAEEKRSYQHVEGKDAKTPEEDLTLGLCSQLKSWFRFILETRWALL